MQTNFFRQLTKLNLVGDLQLILRQADENSLVLSVLLNNEQCGDKAKNLILPLNLSGTAEELDNGFFENISAPLQRASGLMVNMESFMKQLEEAKKESAMEKEKSDKDKKETKEEKYKDAFQKAEELEKEGNYKGAWSALPKASEYPDYADIIRKKQDEYERHFAPSLFNTESIENIEQKQEQEHEEEQEQEQNFQP
ncbi:prtrc system protein e [Chryseobacterium pennae]|uniref:Prtrc system protein e n=1 Tax=Chryseobacterium pennae TaxID=2258962 RepID=A0A3D9C2M9_9FLAO|nr:PRTRC system protein E [Chryseobacterium pennae]REC60127.1 prtrc system protein e [Chryseobacterium pennae]